MNKKLAQEFIGRSRYELIHFWEFFAGNSLINIGFAPSLRDGDTLSQPAEIKSWCLTVYDELWAKLEKQARLPDQPRILEIGCGQGAGLRQLVSLHKGQFFGIDASRVASLIARLRGLNVKAATSQALPFKDASLDIMLCVEALFIFPEADRALAEIRRGLRKGGLFAMAEFAKAPFDEISIATTQRIEATGFKTVGFYDYTDRARQAILQGEPHRAKLHRRIPRPLRNRFRGLMSLKGSDRYQNWLEGKYSYYIAVFEAV